MSGSIEEVPLPDLLQLFGTSKKNGVLVIRTDDDNTGRIYLRKGNIYFAIINDFEDIAPIKSIYRMITWDKGTFDLEPPDEKQFPNEVDLTVQEVLMEGLRQLDEFNVVKDRLPDLGSRIAVPTTWKAPLRDLKPEELDVFQASLGATTLQAVLNRSPGSDLDTIQVLDRLVKGGYIKVESA
jgi:hypothetical protein